MNITREAKKAEAIARMKLLNLFPETVRQFEMQDLVSISEPPVGAFFWLEGEDLDRVRQFEEEYNAIVYVAIRSYTTIGKMDSFLYVSDYPQEWETDREDLKNGEALAYVYNHDAPDCSEIGYIGIAGTIAAGLRRTW
jgi:hypothetical protein